MPEGFVARAGINGVEFKLLLNSVVIIIIITAPSRCGINTVVKCFTFVNSLKTYF